MGSCEGQDFRNGGCEKGFSHQGECHPMQVRLSSAVESVLPDQPEAERRVLAGQEKSEVVELVMILRADAERIGDQNSIAVKDAIAPFAGDEAFLSESTVGPEPPIHKAALHIPNAAMRCRVIVFDRAGRPPGRRRR